MYNQNFLGAGVMTPSVPLSFYAQLLPLPKPLLLLPAPHSLPPPPNKNFGHRLDPRGALLINKDRGAQS